MSLFISLANASRHFYGGVLRAAHLFCDIAAVYRAVGLSPHQHCMYVLLLVTYAGDPWESHVEVDVAPDDVPDLGPFWHAVHGEIRVAGDGVGVPMDGEMALWEVPSRPLTTTDDAVGQLQS